MNTRHKLLRLLLITTMLITANLSRWTGPTPVVRADGPPVPLPEDCGGSTGPVCCIYGYIYYEDVPVLGVNVHIESAYGAIDVETENGEASSDPYYSADLSSVPLLVVPGDVITITASYSDMVSARTWIAQSDGQHVDLGLVAGYRAPGPVLAPTQAATTTPVAPNDLRPRANQSVLVPTEATAATASARNVELVGHIGGATKAVFVQWNYAYVGEGPRLTVLDISDPASPAVVGKTDPLPDIVQDVYVSGDYAYVAAGGWGLRVVDVGDPTNPVEVGSCVVWGIAQDVYVSGSTAYVAAGLLGGLRVVNVSDPTNPVEDGFYNTPGEARGVYVSGSIAYVAEGERGLRIVEVSDPVSPSCKFGSYDTPGYAYDVYVSGTVAYVTDGYEGLRVVDVSDPASPTEVGDCDTPAIAWGVHVSGSTAYVADVFRGGPLGPVGLRVVDVSDLDSPTLVGFYEMLSDARGVYVSGSTAYVANGHGGLGVVDVSDPASPTVVGNCDARLDAQDVYVSSTIAYVANWDGLWIVDVSDPTNPEEVGFHETPGQAVDVYVSGNIAYVADWEEGLRLIDVSNPANPWEVGFYDTPWYAYGVYVSGTIAYVADGGSGLQVIDVSDPTKPKWLGSCDTDDARGVYVSGSTAYVADTWGGLRVIDVSDPVSPTLVGTYNTPGPAESVYVSGSTAYVADGYGGLRVMDVSDPANPAEVGFYDTPGYANDVYVSGNIAYVADGGGGLFILYYTGAGSGPPARVTVSGPTRGGVNATHTFIAAVSPLTTTRPITYVWQAPQAIEPSPVTHTGGWRDTVGFTWGTTGTQVITVTATNISGTVSSTHAITIYAPPDAAFAASPLSGTVPLTVTFTDQSTGAITTWDWVFGDGSISGARHPGHEYTDPGIYTVSLIVSGPGGSDTETKTDYITALPPDGIPTCEINHIFPNPVTQHPTQTLYFNGNCYDNDEGGAYIITHRWHSSIDGLLSTAENFSILAPELSAGAHIISLQGQDDECDWSPEVTDMLTVEPLPLENIRTLILVNRQKLEALYNAFESGQVMDKLDELAAHDSAKGLVVQVENDAAVAAAYAAWDADPTNTTKANAVAAAIKVLVDTHWAAHPDLEYLVIAGDDRVVPFRRVLDQTGYPESNYSGVSPTSITGAALHDDMSLTDDYYADAAPTVPGSPSWDGHDLYIPDLGTGRLIETPAEIIAQIDAFLADDEVTTDTAIVTGYDFVKDGAQAACDELSGDGLTTDCTLVGESWNSTDFIVNVLDTHHDVVSINGHAHHYVIGTPSGTVYSNDIAGAIADHTQAIFYTVGCHSGLNVPPTNPYQPLDTAQALIQHQANYVANTGYGWGYRASIGLSEQLMLDFIERLVYGQSATLGQALAAAKQEYYLDEGDFDYYDEEIMIESTLYGLPMARYATPTATFPKALSFREGQGATAIKEEQVAVLGDGLTVNSISYQFPALIAESTDEGLYYTFGGMVHTGDREPIQPKYTADLSFPGTRAHGVVFKGGVYIDEISFNPVVDQAITETVPLAEPAFSAPGWYPALPHRLNRLERGDNLVTLLAQFNSQSQTERVYDRLSFDVYYHTSSSDWAVPTITSMSSGLGVGSALITVGAEDDSGIEAVVIAYTDEDGTWASTDLTVSGSLRTGSIPASADTEFFIQVVDKAGNVAVSDNNGQYFKPGDSLFAIYLPLVLRTP